MHHEWPAGVAGSWLVLLASTTLSASEPTWPEPLGHYAGGEDACIAVYDHRAEVLHLNDSQRCAEPLAPCSTFKIPHALIGLDLGLLSGPGHVKRWDGTEHRRTVQNRDHDLASSIRYSIVWYYQELALEIGPDAMMRYLELFNYGNRDISGGQDIFWLGSTLKISALGQVGFMAALDAEALPASRQAQQQVRAMMRQDDRLPEGFTGELYGKTGSCEMPEGDHGWFAGFYHRDGQRYSFAVNVKGDDKWGQDARRIALNLMQALP
jgi:beta-lactamase class D